MFDSPCHAVLIDTRHLIARDGLDLRLRIPHRDARTDRLHHLDVIETIAKGNAFPHGDAKMCEHFPLLSSRMQ